MLVFFQVFFAVPLLFSAVRWCRIPLMIFPDFYQLPVFFWQLVERNLLAWFPFSHSGMSVMSVIVPEISEALLPLPQ